jgi:hypothetical protein
MSSFSKKMDNLTILGLEARMINHKIQITNSPFERPGGQINVKSKIANWHPPASPLAGGSLGKIFFYQESSIRIVI